ncbi:MAG: hypothetical protein RIC87_19475 [Kiloniellales bacterium]
MSLLFLILVACASSEPQPPETQCLKLQEQDQEPIDGGFGGTGQSPSECQPETPL